MYGTIIPSPFWLPVYLVETAVLFGTGPMLLAFLCKTPISRKQRMRFSGLYTFAVWLVFNLIRCYVLDMPLISATTAALWCIFFYDRSLSILRRRGLTP